MYPQCIRRYTVTLQDPRFLLNSVLPGYLSTKPLYNLHKLTRRYRNSTEIGGLAGRFLFDRLRIRGLFMHGIICWMFALVRTCFDVPILPYFQDGTQTKMTPYFQSPRLIFHIVADQEYRDSGRQKGIKINTWDRPPQVRRSGCVLACFSLQQKRMYPMRKNISTVQHPEALETSAKG